MPLIDGSRLLQRFRKHLKKATHVDIAVAWAGPSCDAVDELEISAENNTKIRIAVGLSYNSTNPTTLDRLKKFADLRIGTPSSNGIFHPKYYCFHTPKRTICWVGSANLTNGGFRSNAELVHEFEVKNKEDLKWFELLWKNLKPDPTEEITNYKENYTPPRRLPRPKPRKTDTKPELSSLVDIKTWDDFVSGLKALDDYCHYRKDKDWDILGETHSYLHTIKVGREVVRLRNWTNLTRRECHILRGYKKDTSEGEWGLLGTVVSGGASYVFNPERMPEVSSVRQRIQEQVGRVLNANPRKIADVAQDAMERIRNMQHVENADRRIGHAAATRWLTLARPDCLVSINSESSRKLGELSGLPKASDKLADNYAELLGWVHTQDWFKSPRPNDPLEQDIWNCRAALLDAFVYVA